MAMLAPAASAVGTGTSNWVCYGSTVWDLSGWRWNGNPSDPLHPINRAVVQYQADHCEAQGVAAALDGSNYPHFAGGAYGSDGATWTRYVDLQLEVGYLWAIVKSTDGMNDGWTGAGAFEMPTASSLTAQLTWVLPGGTHTGTVVETHIGSEHLWVVADAAGRPELNRDCWRGPTCTTRWVAHIQTSGIDQ
jgi:hypothetical protein